MPQNHRFYDEVNSQTADYYLERAKEIGTCMHILMHDILKSAEHEEQMYRACDVFQFYRTNWSEKRESAPKDRMQSAIFFIGVKKLLSDSDQTSSNPSRL